MFPCSGHPHGFIWAASSISVLRLSQARWLDEEKAIYPLCGCDFLVPTVWPNDDSEKPLFLFCFDLFCRACAAYLSGLERHLHAATGSSLYAN